MDWMHSFETGPSDVFSDVFFCVNAVFVIVSVDYLSVILPISKLTSSNVFRFRPYTMLLFLFVTKPVKTFQFIC